MKTQTRSTDAVPGTGERRIFPVSATVQIPLGPVTLTGDLEIREEVARLAARGFQKHLKARR